MTFFRSDPLSLLEGSRKMLHLLSDKGSRSGVVEIEGVRGGGFLLNVCGATLFGGY